MKSSWRAGCLCLSTLAAVGILLKAIIAPHVPGLRAQDPKENLQGIEGALGQGVAIGLLGGFRAIIADFLWLSVNTNWEVRDLPKTQTLIKLTTAVDSRPLYFWINGARMIGYDMPQWRIEAAGGHAAVPGATQARFSREQAIVAIEYLESGLRERPADPFLLLEVGNIHLRRLGDVARAASYYREASLQPQAPYYAARIYAELLKQLGRKRDALEWLKGLHPGLSPVDPMAMAEVVLERIRALEDELAVPPEERYVAEP